MSDRNEIVEANARIATLERRLRQSQHELEQLRRQEEEILSSSSWRITAPLRAVMQRLRGRSPGGARRVRPSRSNPGRSDTEAGDRASLRQPVSAARMAAVTALLPGLPAAAVHGGECSDENGSCRLLDATPAMASLLDEHTLQQLANLDTIGTPQERYFGSRNDVPAIAFLGSNELLGELCFDARTTALCEQSWQQQLQPGCFSFVLLETVWHAGQGAWRYALTAEGAGRSGLERLLEHCHAISLPVVAWFRSAEDDYPQFAWLAGKVDLACAVDEATASRLRQDYPSTNVMLLPVAVQPMLHNPLRPLSLLDASNQARKLALYDGWWELLEGAARDPVLTSLGALLRVTESAWDVAVQRLDDCPEYRERMLGCVGAMERAALGKLFGVEVVTAAELLPQWQLQQRLLRSAAAGALPVHTGGLPEMLQGLPHRGEPVVLAQWIRQTLGDPLQRARLAHVNFRRVVSEHCLVDRLQAIADRLGVAAVFAAPAPRVACLLVTMRPQLLPQCLERFRNQSHAQKELVVVLHGDADLAAARALIRPDEPIRMFRMGAGHSLGACLNFAFAQTDAPYWTKMDDDDLYGPDYLADMLLYRRTSIAPLMGKPITFVHYEKGDQLHWLPEWAEQRSLRLWQPGHGLPLLAGGTLFGRREVLQQVPFSERRRRGCDSDFLQRCQQQGMPVLAADGFGFALFRSERPEFHTWRAGSDVLRGQSCQCGTLAEANASVFA